MSGKDERGGWAKTEKARKVHYFRRDHWSLCKQWHYQGTDFEPEIGYRPNRCHTCLKKLGYSASEEQVKVLRFKPVERLALIKKTLAVWTGPMTGLGRLPHLKVLRRVSGVPDITPLERETYWRERVWLGLERNERRH